MWQPSARGQRGLVQLNIGATGIALISQGMARQGCDGILFPFLSHGSTQKLSVPKTLAIDCDNRQTIRLLVDDSVTLQTKLRHVKIHSHWLRQAVRSDFTGCLGNKMIADKVSFSQPPGSFSLR